MVASLDFNGRWRGPLSLGTMTVGTAWANLGTSFQVGGARWLGAYADVSIMSGTALRIRLRARHTNGGSAFQLPIQTVGSATVDVADRLIEFASDSDQKQIVTFELDGIVPWAQFQASVAGGSAYFNSFNVVTSL